MKKFAQLLAACTFVFALSFGATYAQSASSEAAESPVKVEKVATKATATPAATQAKRGGCCSMKAASSTPSCCASKSQSSAASCHGSNAKASSAAATESNSAVAVKKEEQ